MSFEHFVETLDNVPPELQRNFNLIRDLDHRTQKLMLRIKECQQEYEKSTNQGERTALREETDKLFSKLFSYADDKIELACLTYDLVDKNINRLLSLQPISECGKVELLLNREMPNDPHEPVYCTCRQVSSGEMVACDNNECLVEWFHYQCVGLTEAPKSEKWYCPQCLAQMQTTKPVKPARSKKRKH